MTIIGNLHLDRANQLAYLVHNDGTSLLLTANNDCEEWGFRDAFYRFAGHEGCVFLDGTVGTCGVNRVIFEARFLSGLPGGDPTKPHKT